MTTTASTERRAHSGRHGWYGNRRDDEVGGSVRQRSALGRERNVPGVLRGQHHVGEEEGEPVHGRHPVYGWEQTRPTGGSFSGRAARRRSSTGSGQGAVSRARCAASAAP